MSPWTLIRYLFGDRRAILAIAATPGALWLGLVFVLSAGLAREYDGEDLLREPWHLALPLAASLATSFLLYCLISLVSLVRDGWRRGFLGDYRRFLSLYWMTAPLAWLYAIPVERMLSAHGATQANLWLLGIVAAWRVILMIRVVSVVFDVKVWQALFLVMLFADTVALTLLSHASLPIVAVMGGIRLTESERLIQATAFNIAVLGALSWPIWLIGSVFAVAAAARRKQGGWRIDAEKLPASRGVSLAAWSLGAASLLIWIGILPATQREQQLRSRVERQLRQGRVQDALAIMSAHEQSDFPPHWDPPPRIGYGEQRPAMLETMEILFTMDAKPWVRDVYLEKFSNHGADEGYYWFWDTMDDDRFNRYLALLERLDDPSAFLKEHEDGLRAQLSEYARRDEVQKARLRALLERNETAPLLTSQSN